MLAYINDPGRDEVFAASSSGCWATAATRERYRALRKALNDPSPLVRLPPSRVWDRARRWRYLQDIAAAPVTIIAW